MKKINWKWVVVILAAISSQSRGINSDENEAVNLLTAMPPPAAEEFRCDTAVKTVNCLRHLGKEGALKALAEYVQLTHSHPEPGEQIMDTKSAMRMMEAIEKVPIVCRLLFVNPSGWKVPALGAPEPPINTNTLGKLPMYPIALSKGIPFCVVLGFHGGGRPESPSRSLSISSNLALIPADLPTNNYEAAAQELISSSQFQSLYLSSNDLNLMSQLVRREAQIERNKNQ